MLGTSGFLGHRYITYDKDARKKLNPTTKLRIFVGYTDTTYNYWVYFLTNMMIVVGRDVIFDDEKAIRVSLERDLELHEDEELLAPKVKEPQIDVEKLHSKDLGVETST